MAEYDFTEICSLTAAPPRRSPRRMTPRIHPSQSSQRSRCPSKDPRCGWSRASLSFRGLRLRWGRRLSPRSAALRWKGWMCRLARGCCVAMRMLRCYASGWLIDIRRIPICRIPGDCFLLPVSPQVLSYPKAMGLSVSIVRASVDSARGGTLFNTAASTLLVSRAGGAVGGAAASSASSRAGTGGGTTLPPRSDKGPGFVAPWDVPSAEDSAASRSLRDTDQRAAFVMDFVSKPQDGSADASLELLIAPRWEWSPGCRPLGGQGA